ncbi:VWA domain-containing protein [Tepidibacillus marianensis]|uniref:VWA domain-containing protein n=1 Tax=Tepidibacillus marianensis TaxID=3131995 RepID=UPI0030D0AC72
MKNQIVFQQIVLITDGYSNVGVPPIEAAKIASDQGIIVHVIGISDYSSKEIEGRREIEEIAKSGGGYSQIVELGHVAKTVELFTKKTMNSTIQQIVQQQLKEVLHDRSFLSIPLMSGFRLEKSLTIFLSIAN